MSLPVMKLLRRHPVPDIDSAVRRAFWDSPHGYFPSAHAEEHDLDDALTAVVRIDPAGLLPFEVMSAIFAMAEHCAREPATLTIISVGHWTGCPSRYTSLALARSKEMPITVACISTSVNI
ncbi:hypothetical protein FB107DRAFT_279040 [Schizophyllum commune]